MMTIAIGVVVFTLVVLLLVAGLMLARTLLIADEDVNIVINDDPAQGFVARIGPTLLNALTEHSVLVASACGGRGTCGACKVRVLEGGGPILPAEYSHVSRKESVAGVRLACQLKVKTDLRLWLPPDALAARRVVCRVRSNRNVATFIREVVLELPEGERLDARAGAYIQLESPPYELRFRDVDIAERFRPAWESQGLFSLEASSTTPTTRAYSLANYPGESDVLMLNVRIALAPPDKPEAPPGVVSSYVFGLRPGDQVAVSGPFGEFFAQETDREMVFVGGGAGMAPLRAHIFDQLLRLRTSRRLSYWYGARSLGEAFYVDELKRLEREHENFSFHLALSEPLAEDGWTGDTGFIHQVLHDRYLKDHPLPEEVEYYLCGPPLMVHAVRRMLGELGVESDNVRCDEF